MSTAQPATRPGVATACRAADPAPIESARGWIEEFLCRPHPLSGRDGAVCPFVAPAIRAGTLCLREWPVPPYADVTDLLGVIQRMTRTFESIPWAGSNRTLHALVVVLTGLADDRLELLDEAHALAKPAIVCQGLMLGQFHGRCDERAARNPEFRVSRSPVPLLALRRIAFHDVLFLSSEPEWFAAYRKRYGARYERSLALDPLFQRVFARALNRWGADEPPSTVPADARHRAMRLGNTDRVEEPCQPRQPHRR